jgi:uncharacterized phage protein gp47/JayE
MPPIFKSQQEIYDDMKSALTSQIPGLTNWSPGGIARALLDVVAAAIRVAYVVLQSLFFNMFPQDADRETLKRFYEEWGLTWDDPDEETARATVLNKYRESVIIGTKAWYELTVKTQFDVVTEAVLSPNYRGPGTADLLVLSHGRRVGEDDLADIRDFFAQDANKVIGVDLYVKTLGEQYGR